jgi:electron transfer flavoprotein alpha/beta subunit
MANRVNKTLTLRLEYYVAKLAKALEDKAKARNCTGHKDTARYESKLPGLITIEPESYNRSKFTY